MMKKRMANIITLCILLFSMALSGCAAKDPMDGMDLYDGVKPNAASALIPRLTSNVNGTNRDSYDYTDVAIKYLETIATSIKKKELGMWIIDELVKAGYDDRQIMRQSFPYYDDEDVEQKGCNIVLTVEGEDPSKQIIAGAHYDGDGVGDNGSGTALLLANAVKLADVKPHYTLKYIFFDAEEAGCYGSSYYVEQMTQEEIDATLYMINLDALAFGDYCHIYGGDIEKLSSDDPRQKESAVSDLTEAYDFAADTAEQMGFQVMRTADLDGYYKKHGTGPEIQEKTLYTNPWTNENPSPSNYSVASPATLPASDHVGFMDQGIAYVYFEATNWFAEGGEDDVEATSYTGYVETYDYRLGEHGMFMNTKYDTWENLCRYFPGRAEAHYHIYSPLLAGLLLVK